MALDANIRGVTSGTGAEVAGTNQLKIIPEVDAATNAANIGGVRVFSENDQGTVTGVAYLASPEVDDDYRLRVAQDVILEDELFNYTAQNTGKHTIVAAAVGLVPNWTNSGYNTNPTNVTTTTSGATLQTYATFSLVGTGTLSVDTELAFSAAPVSNTTIDFGLFSGATTNPFAPSDGAYFRLTSAGLQGIVNYNGSETSSGIFPLANGTGTWAYTANQKYQFILYITARGVEFWVNDGTGAVLLGDIATPAGQGTPYLATGVPFRIRHAIAGGAASAGLSAQLSRYNVRLGGISSTDNLGLLGSRALGSYQALSGSTPGSLMSGTVTTGSVVPPTAATPTNTTAALGTGLGGTFYETVNLAVATDGIIDSYQVPAAATGVQGRRLKVTGVSLASFVQTVVAGGPYVARFYVAFGHTAVSLATAEAATTKAPRRMMTPMVQLVTAAQAVSTLVAQTMYSYSFDNPIYVNPGEFIALVTTHTGTAGTTGTVAHQVAWDYTWE